MNVVKNHMIIYCDAKHTTLLIALKSWHSDGLIDTHEGKVIWWHYHNATMSSGYNDMFLPFKMLQQENHHVYLKKVPDILVMRFIHPCVGFLFSLCCSRSTPLRGLDLPSNNSCVFKYRILIYKYVWQNYILTMLKILYYSICMPHIMNLFIFSVYQIFVVQIKPWHCESALMFKFLKDNSNMKV